MTSETRSATFVEGLNHVGFTVADLDRTLAFFIDVLGFSPGARVELDEEFAAGVTGVANARISVAFAHGPGVDVELLQYAGDLREPARTPSPADVGAAHLALFVSGIEAIAEAAAHVGWYLAGAIQPITTGPRAGGRAAYLRDGSGATVELVEKP